VDSYTVCVLWLSVSHACTSHFLQLEVIDRSSFGIRSETAGEPRSQKCAPPLGPLKGPNHSPTVGSFDQGNVYERSLHPAAAVAFLARNSWRKRRARCVALAVAHCGPKTRAPGF
jgi:hypothetical protein